MGFGRKIKDLRLEKRLSLREFSRQIENEVYDWLDPTSCVKRRNLPGGTGPEQVKRNLEKAKKELKS